MKKELAAVQLALPKGRMQEGVDRLLSEAGIHVSRSSRSYRPTINLPDFEVKILKPQTIVEMLHADSRDLGFAGADWVRELDANLVELLDTELDQVRIVAAAPRALANSPDYRKRKLIIASEYVNLTRQWITSQGLDAQFVHSYGATEVLPPEDADIIVDNTASGSTLEANDLAIIDEVMRSSTRLFASQRAMDTPHKRDKIEHFVVLVRSVLAARNRVMIELNTTTDGLEKIVEALPAMRRATVSTLYEGAGFAVKAAVLRSSLPTLIPLLRSLGGTDIVITAPSQIVE